jgi:hypothetical protein
LILTLGYNLRRICGMQAKAMTFNPAADKVAHKHQHSAEPKYKKVLHQRKHAIRGLWVRNGRVEDFKATRRRWSSSRQIALGQNEGLVGNATWPCFGISTESYAPD